MPTITDWLMVVITAIYVVATIIICFANIKSARATQKQVAESKRQYEDEKRLKILPCLLIKQIPYSDDIHYVENCSLLNNNELKKEECADILSSQFCFCISNVGHDIAKGISHEWKNGANSFTVNNVISLTVNDTRLVKVNFEANKCQNPTEHVAQLKIYYCDLFNNRYLQTVNFYFTIFNEIKLKSFGTTAPEYLKNEDKNNA